MTPAWLPPCIVLSPHRDDALLSAHALIASGRAVCVINAFTASPVPPMSTRWDRRCGFPDSDAAAMARCAEDREAFAGLPTEVVDAGLLDGMYLRGPRPPGDVDALQTVVESAIVGLDPSVALAVPAGAGRPPRSSALKRAFLRLVPARGVERRTIAPHPDHVWLRDAGLAIAGRLGRDVVVYEEIPHGMGFPADAVVSRLNASLTGVLHPFELRPDLDDKVRRIRCYRSQLDQIFPAWLTGPVEQILPTTERYWAIAVD